MAEDHGWDNGWDDEREGDIAAFSAMPDGEPSAPEIVCGDADPATCSHDFMTVVIAGRGVFLVCPKCGTSGVAN